MINRIVISQITEKIDDNKAILILGPRQCGKTTLVKEIVSKLSADHIWWNGDEADLRIQLSNPTSSQLRQMIGKSRLLVIDEAQRIENIGICIKLITDELSDVKVIATGSSSFELANRINEPLTGRKWEFTLLPFSFEEMVKHKDLTDEKRLLEQRLIYGYYPDVVNNPSKEREILKELSDSYLYKDILIWEKIKKAERMERLVQALAFQIGNQVSYHELGQQCGLDNQTVERYIHFLEKAFIVFRLGSLSRNLRNELKKNRKIYFFDNGLRNALINNFNPLSLRQDAGALWENYLMSERFKYHAFHRIFVNRYFWRTHAQQEIDYVEEQGGALQAFEFKWNPAKRTKFPSAFLHAYPVSHTGVVSPENYVDFLTGKF